MTQNFWLAEGVSVGDGDEVANSIADRLINTQTNAEIVDMHFHSRGYWYGQDPGDTFLLENGLSRWQLQAGAGGAFGNWVQLSNGDEIVADDHYDPHEIIVYTASAVGKLYYIQFATGEAGAQVVTGMTAALPAATLRTAPYQVQSERIASTSKLWARCNCETDAATIDFVIGLHLYG